MLKHHGQVGTFYRVVSGMNYDGEETLGYFCDDESEDETSGAIRAIKFAKDFLVKRERYADYVKVETCSFYPDHKAVSIFYESFPFPEDPLPEGGTFNPEPSDASRHAPCDLHMVANCTDADCS